jgi:hypothetical protein
VLASADLLAVEITAAALILQGQAQDIDEQLAASGRILGNDRDARNEFDQHARIP